MKPLDQINKALKLLEKIDTNKIGHGELLKDYISKIKIISEVQEIKDKEKKWLT